MQRSRGMDGDAGRAGHQRGTTEKTRTRHPLEQHTQLGLRLQPRVTHSRSSLPPGPPALTVQEPMEAADTHWYSCSPILKNFLRNHSWGKKKTTHTKLKWLSLGHIHNICLKPSLVKKDPTSPEGLHHGQAALAAFSLTAGSITAPMGTTAPPLILGPPGIMQSVGGHLSHEQICGGGGKKAAAQRSYAHGS